MSWIRRELAESRYLEQIDPAHGGASKQFVDMRLAYCPITPDCCRHIHRISSKIAHWSSAPEVDPNTVERDSTVEPCMWLNHDGGAAVGTPAMCVRGRTCLWKLHDGSEEFGVSREWAVCALWRVREFLAKLLSLRLVLMVHTGALVVASQS